MLDFILITSMMVIKELNQGKTVERRWRKTKGTYSSKLKSASCRFAGLL